MAECSTLAVWVAGCSQILAPQNWKGCAAAQALLAAAVQNFPSLSFFMLRWEAAEAGGKSNVSFWASRIQEEYFKVCIPKKPRHLRKYLLTPSLCLLMLFPHPSLLRGSFETTDSASAAWLLFERWVNSLIRRTQLLLAALLHDWGKPKVWGHRCLVTHVIHDVKCSNEGRAGLQGRSSGPFNYISCIKLQLCCHGNCFASLFCIAATMKS